MVLEFQDENGKFAHDEFQKWRRKNANGFFVNVKSKNNLMLHRVSCSHPGDSEWTREENKTWGSLTKNRKACAEDVLRLQSWAKEKYKSAETKMCNSCKPA